MEDDRRCTHPVTATASDLSVERTLLAFERTYSAWVRTGITATGAAIGLHVLLESRMPDWIVHVSGTAFIIFGALCFVAGGARARTSLVAFGDSQPALQPMTLLIMNALLFTGSVAAAISIWID